VFLSPLARATKNEAGEFRVTNTSAPGRVGGGDKSKLNLALKHLSKSISWKSLSKSASRSSVSSHFLHVDSRGEIAGSPMLSSPGSAMSATSDGASRTMRRTDSSASLYGGGGAQSNQDMMTQVPLGSGGSFSRAASEAALNSLGMTHSLSGLNLTSASLEADSNCGVGVDVEEIAEFATKDEAFFTRNYTPREIEYCRAQANPAASFAGKWAAKEAVLKALSSLYTSSGHTGSGLQGAGAALVDVEIMAPSSSSGSLAPQVALKGAAEKLHKYLNLASIQLSISHAGSHALSLAMARSHSMSRPTMTSNRSVVDLSKATGSSSSSSSSK
jgi:phosphopantetheine--protein transferase-like protein